MRFHPILKKIPNYTDYFLIDGFSLCEPGQLTPEDLENFDKKCSALKKMDINTENINQSLEQLLAVNMPYGGIDVGDFFEENANDPSLMIRLNHSLGQLLEKGVIPMNHLGIYHCDLKSPNILVREENGELKTRIIDWGLSTKYQQGQKIPRVLLERPFQYNVPFSNILFTTLFTKQFDAFLKELSDSDTKLEYYNVRTFVINYVLAWVNKRGPGHLKTINSIFEELFENTLQIENVNKNILIEYEFTFYFIFEYITKILLKYTKNGQFEMVTYFSDVFLKNIDVWGFVFSYIPIIEYLYTNYKTLSADQEKIVENMKEMILLLLEHSDTPIPIPKLMEKIYKMDKLFTYLDKNTNPKQMGESSKTENKMTTFSRLSTNSNSHSKKLIISSKPASSNTKRNNKKRLHKKVLRTLKHIKTRNSNRQWI
jgi:serine/threonine protein kinase